MDVFRFPWAAVEENCVLPGKENPDIVMRRINGTDMSFIHKGLTKPLSNLQDLLEGASWRYYFHNPALFSTSMHFG
jgi:hypothetical protein